MDITELLYSWQLEAVEAIVKRRRQGLFDEPGLGKTMVALGVMEQDGLLCKPARILVLATKTGAALTWLPHAERLLPSEVQIVDAVHGNLPARHRALLYLDENPTVVVANHAFIELKQGDSFIWDIEWDMIVVDESHKVLPMVSHSDKESTEFWRGLRRLKTRHDTIRLALSGTPDRGLLSNRYGTWAFLLPERYNDSYPYETWLLKEFHVGRKRIRVRKTFFIDQVYAKSVKDQEAWNALESVMTIRRTKKEMAPWLPAKRYIDVEQPLSPKMLKAYNDYLDSFNDDGSDTVAHAFLIRATQFAICGWQIDGRLNAENATAIVGSESWKRDWLLDWLDTRKDTDSKVVIASTLSEVLRWLQTELAGNGFPAEILDGSLSLNARQAIQTGLQTGDTRIVLLNTALGDSIDLDAADDLIFIDEAQDPDVNTQTEDRLHRVSRDHQVTIWRLRSLDTIDMIHAAKSQKRYDTTRTVYDGRRGVDYARQVVARLRS